MACFDPRPASVSLHAIALRFTLASVLLPGILPAASCLPRPDYVERPSAWNDTTPAAFASLRPLFRAQAEEHSDLDHAGLAVFSAEGELLFADFPGRYNETHVIPVASASKWISAAILLRLVDRGALSLQTRTSALLTDSDGNPWSGPAGAITLEQALAFQTGFPRKHGCTRDPDLTLLECARQIYADGLEHEPDSGFAYGNTHMHVAAAMALAADPQKRNWDELFEDEFRKPFQANPASAYYARPWPRPERGDNPLIAGGLHVSLADYAKFLQMIARRGRLPEELGGGKYLSDRLIDSMLRSRLAPGDKVYFSATERFGHGDYEYALGNWVERKAGASSLRNSSPGLFGFYPWLVRDANGRTRYFAIFGGYHGLFGTGRAVRIVDALRPEIEERLAP